MLAVIASLNVALIVVFTATEVAPDAGVVDVTVGAVGGGGVSVPPLPLPEDPLPHPAKTSTAKTNTPTAPNRRMIHLPLRSGSGCPGRQNPAAKAAGHFRFGEQSKSIYSPLTMKIAHTK